MIILLGVQTQESNLHSDFINLYDKSRSHKYTRWINPVKNGFVTFLPINNTNHKNEKFKSYEKVIWDVFLVNSMSSSNILLLPRTNNYINNVFANSKGLSYSIWFCNWAACIISPIKLKVYMVHIYKIWKYCTSTLCPKSMKTFLHCFFFFFCCLKNLQF